MKFHMNFAGVLLVLLSLPLLLAQPNKARPSGGQHNAAPPIIKTIYPTFTSITVPGPGYTGAWGINSAAEVVGNYGQNINSGDDAHGFLYKNGKIKYFDYPGSSFTVPTGINDSGVIVGYTGPDPIFGFLYRGGIFKKLVEGSDGDTSTLGINNKNDIVGGSGASISGTKGFKMRNGHHETVNMPGQNVYEYLVGINNLGVMVGWTSYPQNAYVYRNGQFQNIDVLGALDTEALGINDGGIVVGYYGVDGAYYGFALSNGRYLSFAYSDAETFATGIHAAGQIAGEYTFDYQTYYGFITDPITADNFE